MFIVNKRNLEFSQAVQRSMSYGLIASVPNICAAPRLKSEAIRLEIASVCLPFMVSRSTGLCHVTVLSCIEHIKKRLACDAWMVFGWLSDVAILDSFFWKMDADELCHGLSKGWLGVAEFHVWVMLDSGEVIDPVVFPTLAENFKRFSCGAGKLNILCPDGHPYKTTPGLPQLQYHPLAVMP